MHRRDNLAHFILAVVVALGLTLLMVCLDAQARIAFVSDRDGNAEIYVIDPDGANPRNLTNHPDRDTNPAWSPDGKRIAFMSDRDGHVNIRGRSAYEIYVMDADGGNQRNLTNNPDRDISPSWSPDGKRIAFVSDRDVDGGEAVHNYEIYVMAADGGNLQRVTNNLTEDEYPSWSPDGKRIAFSARRDGHFENELGITYEIYVMDADGENEQRLTENRNNDWNPSWAPDGKRIAFMSDRKGDAVSFDIYIMNADGGNQQKLTNNRGWDGSPSWSPDGKRIAFMSYRDRNRVGHNTEIYVMDADGGNLQNLTNNPHADASPAWLNSPFSVSPADKKFTMWGRLKQGDR